MSKTPLLIFVGHVSIDRIKNIWGERIQPGGAALYAALGARTIYDHVKLVTAVGPDFKFLDLLRSNFPGSQVKLVNAPTTRFTINYGETFRAKYLEALTGAGAAIKVSDLPAHWIKEGNLIHLAPMRPPKVEKFIEKVKSVSPRIWVSMHSSPDYIEQPKYRRILRKLAEKVDLFVVNDHEALTLTGAGSLIHAIQALKAKRLAITLGQMGAILVENGRPQLIPALTGLVQTPKDTTGAGDVWCGALLAAYLQTEDWTRAVLAACTLSAIKCMGWGFEPLLGLKFKSLDDLTLHVLRLKENRGQRSLRDFVEG
ncbi:MAG: carbohydrate kinase family protein [Candidatus Hecatellaceae archaeon]